MAVALDGFLKSTRFKPRPEPRPPQSSIQTYYKAIAPQTYSTALISSLQAFTFVDNFLLWWLFSDFLHFWRKSWTNGAWSESQQVIETFLLSLGVWSLGDQRLQAALAQDKLQPFCCRQEEEFNSMAPSFLCLMLNEKENFAGTGGHKIKLYKVRGQAKQWKKQCLTLKLNCRWYNTLGFSKQKVRNFGLFYLLYKTN